jgi:hypothetical protein
VVVGLTPMLELFRVGYVKFRPAILGVIVADVALVYDQLSIAVCPEVIVGVVVVREHVGVGKFVTVIVLWQIAGVVPERPFTVNIYVVVVVGLTPMLELFRVGYVKFRPAILGVIVADVALVYDQLSIAVCPEVIVDVVVVSVQVGGGLAATWRIHVQIAEDTLLFTIRVNR